MNNTLLKEAIADAKAVREIALHNAKKALEEAFTPQIQSMLSAKIQQEIDEEDDDLTVTDTPVDDVVDSPEAPIDVVDIEPTPVDSSCDCDDVTPAPVVDVPPAPAPATDVVDVPTPSIDIPVEDQIAVETPEEDEIDVELENIVKELDGEEEMDFEIEDDELEMESKIREMDNELDFEIEDDLVDEQDIDLDIEDDEDINIEELYQSLTKEEEDLDIDIDNDEEMNYESIKAELAETKRNLNRAIRTIKVIKDSLNETKVLNNKLLYVNKIFNAYTLGINQKKKIVEALDKSNTSKDALKIYKKLVESLNKHTSVRKNPIKIVESKGSSSSTVPSTKPNTKILNETSELADRFRKLWKS